MKCNKCGGDIPDDSVFCLNCGEEINTQKDNGASDYVAVSDVKAKKKLPKKLIIICSVVLIVAIGIVMIFMFYPKASINDKSKIAPEYASNIDAVYSILAVEYYNFCNYLLDDPSFQKCNSFVEKYSDNEAYEAMSSSCQDRMNDLSVEPRNTQEDDLYKIIMDASLAQISLEYYAACYNIGVILDENGITQSGRVYYGKTYKSTKEYELLYEECVQDLKAELKLLEAFLV